MDNVNVRNTKNMTSDKIINEWLEGYPKSSYYKHREAILKFLSFIKKDTRSIMTEYNTTKDKNQ